MLNDKQTSLPNSQKNQEVQTSGIMNEMIVPSTLQILDRVDHIPNTIYGNLIKNNSLE